MSDPEMTTVYGGELIRKVGVGSPTNFELQIYKKPGRPATDDGTLVLAGHPDTYNIILNGNVERKQLNSEQVMCVLMHHLEQFLKMLAPVGWKYHDGHLDKDFVLNLERALNGEEIWRYNNGRYNYAVFRKDFSLDLRHKDQRFILYRGSESDRDLVTFHQILQSLAMIDEDMLIDFVNNYDKKVRLTSA